MFFFTEIRNLLGLKIHDHSLKTIQPIHSMGQVEMHASIARL